MSANQQEDVKFTSWKEIAVYLSCDERTCLRWEKKLGLPVHRRKGTSKSTEKCYILFPRTDVDFIKYPNVAATNIDLLENKRISVTIPTY
jgi:hypothetical protein